MIRLSKAAGWNQVAADWERLIDLEPEGCFGLDSDGELAATTTAARFGSRLAWIGMVLTHPDHRRKGYARMLMEHAIEWLEGLRVDWIKLDATEMGAPLYRKLGFEDEGLVERWAGVPEQNLPESSASLPTPTTATGPTPLTPGLLALDAAAFGAPRTEILRNLARGEWVVVDDRGYAMGRSGHQAASFGPCVARSPKVAAALADWHLRRHPGQAMFWDLLPGNAEAVRLAEKSGFELRRRLIRMVRPGVRGAAPLVFDDSLVYATAGFEYG